MQKQSELLAIFVPGPNEYYAMPDMEAAADTVNAWNQRAQKVAPLPDEKSQERARTMCGHARSENARAAALARHHQPGGSVEKRNKMREIWASGKYKSRDTCAKDECDAIGMSYSTARKALRGTPEPRRAGGMTARKIVIQDCGECPHSDHKGAFGKVSRIPVCRKADRELPWTPSVGNRGRVSAKREPGIPDWCPLPNDAGKEAA